MTNQYNGWTNYYTWSVASMLSKSEENYNYFKSLGLTEPYELADQIKDWVEAISPLDCEIDTPNDSYYFFCDILEYALNEVNYLEIANDFLNRD